jgi:hypothetical protein
MIRTRIWSCVARLTSRLAFENWTRHRRIIAEPPESDGQVMDVPPDKMPHPPD